MERWTNCFQLMLSAMEQISGTSGCGLFVVAYFQPATSTLQSIFYIWHWRARLVVGEPNNTRPTTDELLTVTVTAMESKRTFHHSPCGVPSSHPNYPDLLKKKKLVTLTGTVTYRVQKHNVQILLVTFVFLSPQIIQESLSFFPERTFHHTFFSPCCTRITKFMSSEVISEQSGRKVCTSDRGPGLLFFNSSCHFTCRSRRCGIEWSIQWVSFQTGKVQQSYCYSQCNTVVVNHWLTGHAFLSG